MGQSQSSDAQRVREFTEQAQGPTPSQPRPMTKSEVEFVSKMMLDEVMELLATTHDFKEAKSHLRKCIAESKDIPKLNPSSRFELMGEQCDALVDSYYYSLNAACKAGMNMSKLFNVVHDANMAKRDPKTNEFIKREDGKIVKPIGWRGPDVEEEMRQQSQNGSWA